MFFSIANPMGSLMCQLKLLMKLAAVPGVDLRIIDLCAAGWAHNLPTAVLTNCPWIRDLPCDMDVRPHRHIPLFGMVTDHPRNGGSVCFHTALAASRQKGFVFYGRRACVHGC